MRSLSLAQSVIALGALAGITVLGITGHVTSDALVGIYGAVIGGSLGYVNGKKSGSISGYADGNADGYANGKAEGKD